MIVEEPLDEFPEVLDQADWHTAFECEIHDGTGRTLRFREIFTPLAKSAVNDKSEHDNNIPATSAPQLLIIFIRHFFCGNCQEYLRRLVAEPLLSSHILVERNVRIVVIGCGAPSLISSYRDWTGIPQDWRVYTDSATELYRLLGMHRTLSLGKKSPRYIQRSLTSGMLQSIVQGMKRLPEGDMMGAGSLSVNGGEFLFSLQESIRHSAQAEDWRLDWCHRMRNSRDHSEVDVILQHLALTTRLDYVTIIPPRSPHKRTQSMPPKASDENSTASEAPTATMRESDTARSFFRRSLSKRRQSWFSTAERLVRSDSKRRSMTLQLEKSNKIATTVLTHTD